MCEEARSSSETQVCSKHWTDRGGGPTVSGEEGSLLSLILPPFRPRFPPLTLPDRIKKLHATRPDLLLDTTIVKKFIVYYCRSYIKRVRKSKVPSLLSMQ